MKINILGTEYKIVYKDKQEDVNLENCNEYCDHSIKQIVIDKDIEVADSTTMNNLNVFHKKVIRHELIHAFLQESGCSKWCIDEDLVDYIAIQFPKILEAFKEVQAL